MRVRYSELGIEVKNDQPFIFAKEGNCWLLLSFQEKSRYFGFFFFDGENAYRIISEIDFHFVPEIIFVHNPRHYVLMSEKRRVHLHIDKDGFSIIQSGNFPIRLAFDNRKIFETKMSGQVSFQQIDEQKIKTIWMREGNILSEGVFFSKGKIRFLNFWQKEKMSFDEKRNSPPYEFENFYGLEFETDYLSFKIEKPNLPPSLYHQFLPSTENPFMNFVITRINHLFFNSYLPAGFPWFFERWSRDELICFWFLRKFLGEEKLTNLLTYYLNLKEEELFLSKRNGILAADVPLWLINLVPEDVLKEFKFHFDHIFQKWLEKFYFQSSIKLPPKATWMDTLAREDPIEISALFIKASSRLGYKKLALKEKERLQSRLFKVIYDKLNPEEELEICRPNIFLVYQLLPKLFWPLVWRSIIFKIIEKIKLPWGGFSSAPQNNKDFYWVHTGEDSRSYHQGDSWHFLNALGAKTLFELKEDKLAKKTMDALNKEILTLGALGYISELSSARKEESQGALIQTWSMCSFLDLLSTTFS